MFSIANFQINVDETSGLTLFTPSPDEGGNVTGLGLGGAVRPSTRLGLDPLPPNSAMTGEMRGFESNEKSTKVRARSSLELEMLFSRE